MNNKNLKTKMMVAFLCAAPLTAFAEAPQQDLLPDVKGVYAYNVENYGHALEFDPGYFLMASSDDDGVNDIGYISYDVPADQFTLRYRALLDESVVNFVHTVETDSLFDQISQNTPEIVGHAQRVKQKAETTAVEDIAFFPNQDVQLERDKQNITITFKHAGIICEASTNNASSQNNYNNMSCTPL